MDVRFVIVSPGRQQRAFAVRLPVLVGRGEEAKVRIPQDTVSRRHCEFFATADEVFVRDLGSTNGTWLDDEPLPANAATAVPAGAVVRVGTVAFRVEYASTAAAARPEPPAGNDTVPLPADASMEAEDDAAEDEGEAAAPDWPTADPPPAAADDENLNDFFKSLS